MEQLGRIPQVNDSFELGAFRITVIEADAKRVIRVSLRRIGDA